METLSLLRVLGSQNGAVNLQQLQQQQLAAPQASPNQLVNAIDMSQLQQLSNAGQIVIHNGVQMTLAQYLQQQQQQQPQQQPQQQSAQSQLLQQLQNNMALQQVYLGQATSGVPGSIAGMKVCSGY